MKRRELLKKLREIAERRGLELEFVREGSNHEIYRIGDWQFAVGRHADIPEGLARDIVRKAGRL